MFRTLAAVSALTIGCLATGCSGEASDFDGLEQVKPGSEVEPNETVTPAKPDIEPVDPVTDPVMNEMDAGTATPTPGRVDGSLWRITAREGGLATFTTTDLALTANGELSLPANGGTPVTAALGYYNGGNVRVGSAVSPVKVVKGGFDDAVPHFEADTPPGTWVEIRLAARIGTAWTKDYRLGVWASDESTITRRSITGQADGNGTVATDTLDLNRVADAIRITVLLYSTNTSVPSLRAVGVVAKRAAVDPAGPPTDPSAYGNILPVPQISQMTQGPKGPVWCSPTSTTMILQYWSNKLALTPVAAEAVPTAAARIHDTVYGGTGNWPFNMAYAASRGGGRLSSFLTRVSTVSQLEPLVKAGIPVAVSVSYGSGGVPAPRNGPAGVSTPGHILVIRGFTANGDVVVNDPAFATAAQVQATYTRQEVQQMMQARDGLTYVVYPSEMVLPVDPNGAY